MKCTRELNFAVIENGNWYEKRPCSPIGQRRGSAPRFGRFCRRYKKRRRAEYRRVRWRGSNPSSKPYRCDLRVSESLSTPSKPIAFTLCIHRKHWPLSSTLLFPTFSSPRHASEKISENDFNKQTKTNQLGSRNSPRVERLGKIATYCYTVFG